MLKAITYISAFAEKDLKSVGAHMAENFTFKNLVVNQVEGKEAEAEAFLMTFSGCNSLNLGVKKISQVGDTNFIESILQLDTTRLDRVDVIEWSDDKMVEPRAYLDVPIG